MMFEHSTPGFVPPATSVVSSGSAGTRVPRSANSLVKFALAFSTLATMAAGQDVLTSRNDVSRSGVQSNETMLTPANVRSGHFRWLRTLQVDGQVYAQPLYVSSANVFVNGAPQGTHNLLYVATEHDSVYCFDADSGKLYWKRSLLLPGESPSDSLSCTDLQPENGISGTPVIDRNEGPNGTIYVVSFSVNASQNYAYRLNALDLGTGNTVQGPTTINAMVAGTGPGSNGAGEVFFLPNQQRQRSGLALANGKVYIGFGSICDIQPYTGWLMVYDQHSLTQVSAFDANPNDIGFQGSAGSSGAGIWQSGTAPVIASDTGSVIVATGNGPFDPNNQDYGSTVLRLNLSGNVLNVVDYFTPANLAGSLEDNDLGSGGGITFQVAGHSLFALAGKDGNIHLLDMFAPWAQSNSYQDVKQAAPGGVFGGPAYFNGSLYFGHSGGPLLQFTFNSNAMLPSQATSSSRESFAFPGTIPSISASGNTNGIVWASEISSNGQAILHAYAATNVSRELFKSSHNFGTGVKFAVPTIAGGKVFVGTIGISGPANSPGTVGVFGLK